tara:strand:+ start:2161 stop:3006 length:846 start_codon:yes stop_codon:yes gene_type:complete
MTTSRKMMMAASGAGGADASFMGDIVTAELDGNLQFCLDAGSADSYTSGTKWLDLSGNGQDFFRGPDGNSQRPVFNGTAGGLSSSEYWSWADDSGAPYFRYDSANETWMNNMHQNNALWSVCWVIYATDTGYANGMIGTTVSNSQHGFNVHLTSGGTSNKFRIRAHAGNYTNAINETSADPQVNFNAWNFIGMTISEAAGGTASRWWTDRSGEDAFNGTYTSPSSAAATNVLELFAKGAGTSTWAGASGLKVGAVAAWSGVGLTAANFSTLHSAIGPRFGI